MGYGRYISFKTILVILTISTFFGAFMSVNAEDLKDPAVDAEIKTLWNEVVTRLVNKDVEGALDYFTFSSRRQYREQFNTALERLPGVFSGMRNIEPVYIKDNEAKYRIRIKDASAERTAYIWFRKDLLGRWKIDKF